MAPRPAALEGGDPPPADDDLLSARGPVEVDDETAKAFMADVVGGGNNARSWAERVLIRFRGAGWRIVKEG
jgi:hypothetical protein